MNPKEAVNAQNLVDIREIRNGTVVLKTGGLRKIVLVAGINFDLKSEEEQAIILNVFQDFLNSLNFTVQIFIHSRKLNIEGYLESLNARLAEETNDLLRTQIAEYREFIRSFVEQNAIMTKGYFIIVPFDPVKLPAGGTFSPKGLLGGFFGKGKTAAAPSAAAAAEETVSEHIEQLDQRVSHIIEGLNRVGLRAVVLNDEELIELFYNLYNPAAIEKTALEIAKPEHLKEEKEGEAV